MVAGAVAVAIATGLPVGATAAKEEVHGKGRLLAPVLVYVSPPKGKHDLWRYGVYFRTASGFAGKYSGGSLKPGTIEIDEAWDNGGDGSFRPLGAGKPHGRCYFWFVGTFRKTSPKLTKKRVGDEVHLRFRLHKTALQTRTAKLRAWPADANRNSAVKRAVRNIGCPRA